jgi:16S rRNA (cytidine1402-2'-O)-methyltransferase
MTGPLQHGLHIIATPIGNLGDLSPRAADVLSRADLILVEDTRVTAKLLAHIGVKVTMRRYDDHTDEAARGEVLAMLGDKAVALVSDAGTPLISDPGYKLVRAARAAGHMITTVPGPCAAIAALTLSGLPTDRFLFLGFLPAKSVARSGAIQEVAIVDATLILYESGPRLGSCLADLARLLGSRDAAVVREITKLHEECVTGTLAELAAYYANSAPKGEIVVVVGPPGEPEPVSSDEIDRLLREALRVQSPSRAAAAVAEQLGVPRKRVYARALDLSR